MASFRFSGYSINQNGDVRNDRTGHILKVRTNQRGGLCVSLYDDDDRLTTRYLNLLMAKVYLNPPEEEHYDSVIHLNGDKTDVSPNNLMWRPRWFATKYHKQFVNGSMHPFLDRPVMDMHTGVVYADTVDAAIKNGVINQDIHESILYGNGRVICGGESIFDYV